jgi:hypothetical protein
MVEFCKLRRRDYLCTVVKKAAIAILALLYIITTSGIVVNVHYCMGTVASVTYGHKTPESCGKCGMKEKAGCCHSELKVVKLDDVHQQKVKAAESVFSIAALPVVFFQTAVETYNSHKDYGISYHSPPDPRVNAVYLHTNVFRI